MNTLKCPKTHVIAGDLDDSLVATRRHPEHIRRASDRALHRIGKLITNLRAQGEVVYFGSATGRSWASIQELAAERPAFNKIFRTMDFHIASVGSAIYARHEGNNPPFRRVPDWPQVSSWNRTALEDRLSIHPDLTPQEDAAQEEYKISYLSTSNIETAEYAAQLSADLGRTGLQAEVIVSGGHPWRFVDILPVGADKGGALLQLPRLLRSDPDHHDVILPENSVCRVGIGDSMNDRAMLAVADVAIIPANGQPDLLEWAASNQTAGSLFIADGHFAAGVLQGLHHHLYGN